MSNKSYIDAMGKQDRINAILVNIGLLSNDKAAMDNLFDSLVKKLSEDDLMSLKWAIEKDLGGAK